MSTHKQQLREKLKNKIFLIVDDDFIFLDIFKDMLDSYGVQVETAKDGTQALKKRSRINYDLIVSDIEMPGIDGIELTQKIMQQDPTQKMIVLSSHSSQDYLLKLLNYGAKGFLRKPFKIDDLNSLLEKIFIKEQS